MIDTERLEALRAGIRRAEGEDLERLRAHAKVTDCTDSWHATLVYELGRRDAARALPLGATFYVRCLQCGKVWDTVRENDMEDLPLYHTCEGVAEPAPYAPPPERPGGTGYM